MFEYPTYVPRPVTVDGVTESGPFRLKKYHLHSQAVTYDSGVFALGLHHACTTLRESLEEGTPGIGFVIHHQGARMGQPVHYIVLGIWFNKNELRLTTFGSEDNGATWLSDPQKYAPCVWDHEIVWHERNAYVRHVMNGAPDLEAYLRDLKSL